MKILVYGAGVLGSYLAHVLIHGGNDVTVNQFKLKLIYTWRQKWI